MEFKFHGEVKEFAVILDRSGQRNVMITLGIFQAGIFFRFSQLI